MPTVREIKALLDTLGIKYTTRLKKAQLLDLVPKKTEKPIPKKVDLSKSKKVSKKPEITIRRKEDFKRQEPSKEEPSVPTPMKKATKQETQKKRDEAFLDLMTFATKGEIPVKILNKKERALTKNKPLKRDFSKELNKSIAEEERQKKDLAEDWANEFSDKMRTKPVKEAREKIARRKKGEAAEDTRQKMMKEIADDEKKTKELIKKNEKTKGRPQKTPVEITPVEITPVEEPVKILNKKKRDVKEAREKIAQRKKGSPAEDTRLKKLMKELADDEKKTTELIKTTEKKTTEKKRGRPKKVEITPVEITPVEEIELSDEDYKKYIDILGRDDVLSFIPKDQTFSEDVKNLMDKGIVDPSSIPLPDEILRDVYEKFGIKKVDDMSRNFLSREGATLPEKSSEKNWLKRLNN
jgi:hypothetical protein